MNTKINCDNKLEAIRIQCVRGDQKVFTEIDFCLKSSDALLLKGPNGSGKSSLLRILSGLLRCSDGELYWAGNSVYKDIDTYRRSIHFVGHLDGIKPTLTVREHLEFWATLRGVKNSVPRLIEKFGLLNLTDVTGRFLSAGQKRRVSLARLVFSDAPLWLLDEPTVTLDSEAINVLEEAISKHRSAGGIVVVASHTDIKMDDARVINMQSHTPKYLTGESRKRNIEKIENPYGTWSEW